MIDAESLRKKVIDLAIQGKLTQQLPEDGNAEELYAQIQEEKAKLIKDGKIKKEKPLPPISEDEIPFEIPMYWKWVRWGDASHRIQYGYNAPAKEYGRIKMLRISDIQNGKVNWESVPYCDISEDDVSDYVLHENDILFARTGGTVGKSYLVSDISEESIYAGYLIRSSYSSLICSRYMKLFMESDLYWRQLRDGTIATAQPNCNGKALSKMIVPLPPLAEQKRIVEKIEEILSQIDIIDTLQKQYESDREILKRKIIDAGIRGKLTEQLPEDGNAEDLYAQIQEEKAKLIKEGKIKQGKHLEEINETETPFDLPNRWQWCRLESIFNFIDYRGATPNKITEGVPFVTAKNVRQGYIDYSIKEYISEQDYSKRQSRGVSRQGDLLFTTEAPMGFAAIADLERFSAGQRLITLQQYTGFQSLDNKYYMYCIAAVFFRKQLDEKSSGTTVKGIKADRLKMLLIPLPPLAEQKRIVERIDELLACIEDV